MSEVAANIERIYPDGVRQGEYAFAADTRPPRYAIVGITGGRIWVDGPLTEEQLGISLSYGDGVLPHEARKTSSDNPLGYAVECGDIMMNPGEYPGGPDNAARNLAGFVLGIESRTSVDRG